MWLLVPYPLKKYKGLLYRLGEYRRPSWHIQCAVGWQKWICGTNTVHCIFHSRIHAVIIMRMKLNNWKKNHVRFSHSLAEIMGVIAASWPMFDAVLLGNGKERNYGIQIIYINHGDQDLIFEKLKYQRKWKGMPKIFLLIYKYFLWKYLNKINKYCYCFPTSKAMIPSPI